MERINYQHLFYFWNVAKEGSVSKACEKLHLAQPTVSAQLKVFEEAVGEKLFYWESRKFMLTDTGQGVFRYAEEIFALGRELTHFLNERPGGWTMRFSVGISDALPKLLAYRLIEPSLRLSQPIQLVCHEDKFEPLLAEISRHGIDLLLADAPAPPMAGGRIFNHLLVASGVGVFAAPELAERHGPDFPARLDGAPFLLPTQNVALRREVDRQFDRMNIRPNVLGEIEDSALLKTFGSAGVGLFLAPVLVASEICRQYRVELLGELEGAVERFYAITAQRKIKHPAVAAIIDHLDPA